MRLKSHSADHQFRPQLPWFLPHGQQPPPPITGDELPLAAAPAALNTLNWRDVFVLLQCSQAMGASACAIDRSAEVTC